jgi:galactose mutarotase-like enzyme
LIAISDPELQGVVILGETGTRALEIEDETAGLASVVSVEEGADILPVWTIWSVAPEAPYVCLEPWSDIPNALNRPTTRLLGPGATVTTKMRIGIREL